MRIRFCATFRRRCSIAIPKTNDLVPELALSWKQIDPTNWQFKLRQGVKFTDGSPFDAKAAATSINYVLDPKNAFAMRTFLGPDVQASAVDQYTLNIKTRRRIRFCRPGCTS